MFPQDSMAMAWQPCWRTINNQTGANEKQKKLMKMVHQHGRDDVMYRPRISVKLELLSRY